MPRPKQETPTAGELEILKILWERGASIVWDVLTEPDSFAAKIAAPGLRELEGGLAAPS